MRIRSIPLLLAVALSCAVGALDAQEEAVSLFNGKDLAGWDGDPKFWSVKDGALTGVSTAENPVKVNTFLIWKGGTLKNFELRAKYRIEGNNSGIQYRSKDLGEWRVGGYQADIDATNTYTGILYEERGRGILAKVGTKSTVRPNGEVQVTGSVGDPAEIKAAIRKDGWNEYRITARGNHLIHEINGKVTAELIDEDEAKRAMEGILALQLHQGPPMTIQYKDLRLKVLP
jgi:hypothetical protein